MPWHAADCIFSCRYIAGLREAAEKDAPKDGDFEAFATYVLNLLAAAVTKCNKGGDKIPEHLSNLMSFNVSGEDWHKLIGELSACCLVQPACSPRASTGSHPGAGRASSH